jgi:predicted  nucleic acid-binding Zn-ribbon protein
MLKLHHMNLLNEIQETTLMMNLYQQQQLQQQQQQLQQQQASADGSVGGNDQMAMLLQQQQGNASGGIDSLFGNGSGLGQRGSLGLGIGPSQGGDQQMQMLRQQQQMGGASSGGGGGGATQHELQNSQKEQAALEERLQKLKDDIARRQKEAEDLQKVSDAQTKEATGMKRGGQDGNEQDKKRPKLENGQSAAGSKD